MKKYLILFLPLFFLGCEKDFDGVIEPQQSAYRVIASSSFDSLYTETDTTITLFIQVDSISSVSQIYCEIYSSENKKINSSSILLFDNGNLSNGDTTGGDNIYSNNYNFSSDLPIGRYNIRYYLIDAFNKNFLAATQAFTFDNGKDRIAPVLSDLQMPDTVSIGQSFVFSIAVFDTNGLNDVEVVYFELFRPDSTQVLINPDNKFIMHDDGDFAVWGDVTAGDGVYSYRNSFSATAQLGTWRFEFEAKDRSNKLSNRLIHFLEVK